MAAHSRFPDRGRKVRRLASALARAGHAVGSARRFSGRRPCRNVQADPDYSGLEYQEAGYRTFWASRCARWRPIGVIILAARGAAISRNRQIELIQTFADQAVIAIENARLFDEVQAKTRELTNRCSSRPPPPTCSR